MRAGFQPLDAVLQVGELLLQRAHTASGVERLLADQFVFTIGNAEANKALRRLSARLATPVADAAEGAHRRATRDEIERFLARPERGKRR